MSRERATSRRLLQQVGAPRVQEVTGLPPAVALQQRRGAATSRSSVGTLTTLSNLLRILYSRAGDYPAGADHLPAVDGHDAPAMLGMLVRRRPASRAELTAGSMSW